MLDMLKAAIGLLTKFPVNIKKTLSPQQMGQASSFYALAVLPISLVLGGVCALFWWLDLRSLLPFALVGLEWLLTGGLHIDGLADTADAFLAYQNRERTLEILKDVRHGTHGVCAIVLDCLLKVGLYSLLFQRDFLLGAGACVLMPMLAKVPMTMVAAISQYPRQEGMAKAQFAYTKAPQVIWCLLLPLVLGGLLLRHWMVAVLGVQAVLALWMAHLSRRKIGGATGDVLGAVNQLSQLVFLFCVVLLQTTHLVALPAV